MTKRILCPIDLGDEPSAARALPEAASEAQMRGAELHLLAVMPDMGLPMIQQYLPDNHEQTLLQDAMEQTRALAAAKLPSDVSYQCHVAIGHAAEEILRVAGELSVDLIVIASHKPDPLRTFLVGSNADRIVHHATQSVLVLRGPH